ncbi:MAG: GntR family transcriptional regulator, partial [Comamonadaceae bacterium]
MDTPPRYRQLAGHYLQAIQAGSLQPGDRLPSLRALMKLHAVSLSTALQVCRTLESEGWAEARDRSGYFVRRPQRLRTPPMDEPATDRAPDPAQYIGIHEKVSDFVTRRRYGEVRLDLAVARGAPSLYPFEALRTHMSRLLRQRPQMLTTAAPSRSRTPYREAIAQRALRAGMTLSPDEVLPTNGCIEALNLALRAVAQPGDTVAVESPTFYGLLQVLES